tara:strand:+ start:994 stop:1920 length:927 start_codon:yes stop_codon:yes gene_type:complete
MLKKKINLKSELFKKKKNYFSIFLFHGVIKKDHFKIRNYNKKHILENDFIDFLKYIKKNGTSLSIDELIYFRENKINLPKNSFNISFDDGFENNFSIAAPILDKMKLKTTFYFSTDFIDNNSMSWVDKIEYCFELTKEKFIYVNNIGNLALHNNFSKIQSLNKIRKIVKKKLNININKFVKNIFTLCKLQSLKQFNSNIDKKINWSQVKKLYKNPLFTIGGHSHLHMPLTSFNNAQLDIQIKKSIRLFKSKINLNLKHYSYPEGQRIDYNDNIVVKLKKHGIVCCPTAIKGYNSINSNLFNLRRIQIN